MGYGRKAGEIVGYQYMAASYCPEHLIEVLLVNGHVTLAARDMAVEDVLNQLAAVEGVDREDEHTFDSGDFPKVILSVQLEDGETCDWDGHEI